MPYKKIDKWWYVFRFVGIVALMAYFILCDAPNQNPKGHFTVCLFHVLTGYPCPGCGTVRGLKYFFHLDFYNALMMNPLAVIIAIYMVLCLVWTPIDMIRDDNSFDRMFHFKLTWRVFVLCVILLAANWWWNIQKGV